jgi:hypothetical protein
VQNSLISWARSAFSWLAGAAARQPEAKAEVIMVQSWLALEAVLLGLAAIPSAAAAAAHAPSPLLPQPLLARYGPSARAVELQAAIDRAIAGGRRHRGDGSNATSVVSISAGDYYFGSESLVIHRASDFVLRAEEGPGTAQLWFSVGAGILVNQSRDVVLDGLSVDYDPPAHYQGTVMQVEGDDGSSPVIRARVRTDHGFPDPLAFDAAYGPGVAGVQSSPGDGPGGSPALVWNSSDPGFGAYATASWPPTAAAGRSDPRDYMFSLSRASICRDITFTTTDGSSCRDVGGEDGGAGSAAGAVSLPLLRPRDKITAHLRAGFTLHLLNSSRVHTRHTAIHGASGFAITEYDGVGAHSYLNVSVGEWHGCVVEAPCSPSEWLPKTEVLLRRGGLWEKQVAGTSPGPAPPTGTQSCAACPIPPAGGCASA